MERATLSLSSLLFIGISAFAQLPGSVDLSFNATDQGHGYGDGAVYIVSKQRCLSTLVDGKLLVASQGWVDGTETAGLMRLFPDGSIDPTFTTSSTGNIFAAKVQPDGKIIVGGGFTEYGGVIRNNIVRLHGNGSVDMTFDPGTGADGRVKRVVIQSDGKVLIAGEFDNYNGVGRKSMARLNSDGSLDTGFDPGVTVSSSVNAIAVQPDGKILIGGDFTTVGGTSRGRIARLHTNGNLDLSFVPNSGLSNGFSDGAVYCITLTSTGSMLVGGSFTRYRSTTHNRVIMLTNAAAIDPTFTNSGSGFNAPTHHIMGTSDGGWLISGEFATYKGAPEFRLTKIQSNGSVFPFFNIDCRAYLDYSYDMILGADGDIYAGGTNADDGGIVRLDPDGSLDANFRIGVGTGVNVRGYYNGVRDIAEQTDGKMILVGEFSKYNGVPQRSIVRIYPSGAIDLGFGNGEGVTLPNCRTPGLLLCATVQSDGKILVGAERSHLLYDGVNVSSSVFRLLANGTLDPSFSCGVTGDVRRIRLQPDGKIILVGELYEPFSTTSVSVLRIASTGAVDGTFAPITISTTSWFWLLDAAVLPSGKIIVASQIVERYNSNGTKDLSFLDGTTPNAGAADLGVHNIHIRPSGKIVLTGVFYSYNGLPYKGVVQINSDGSIDTTFDPGDGVDFIFPMATTNQNRLESVLQPDGKLILGHSVGGYDGHSVPGYIARIHIDGSFDDGYYVGTGPGYLPVEIVYDVRRVGTMHLDHLGRLYVGGGFSNFNGVGRNKIVRLNGGNRLTPSPRTLLEGAYNPSTFDHWTDLWSLADFPLVEPYSAMGYQHADDGGGESTTLAVLSNQQGPTLILDWVVVELRSANNPQQIVATRSALLRKDGNIVDVDGESQVHFDVPNSSYFMSIHHRNHLGVMTSMALDLDRTNGVNVDFSSPNTQTYGTEARKDINGILVQWAGDVNGDGVLKYTGKNNDRDQVLNRVGGVVPTNVVSGYFVEDVNLNGDVQYTNANNDRDIILSGIGGVVPTNTRTEQLP